MTQNTFSLEGFQTVKNPSPKTVTDEDEDTHKDKPVSEVANEQDVQSEEENELPYVDQEVEQYVVDGLLAILKGAKSVTTPLHEVLQAYVALTELHPDVVPRYDQAMFSLLLQTQSTIQETQELLPFLNLDKDTSTDVSKRLSDVTIRCESLLYSIRTR